MFVLTHHPRPPRDMEGGTVFYFVDGGIESALEKALDTAAGDVRLGGGASSVRRNLQARLVDEIHVAAVPIPLGGGERLFENLDGAEVSTYVFWLARYGLIQPALRNGDAFGEVTVDSAADPMAQLVACTRRQP